LNEMLVPMGFLRVILGMAVAAILAAVRAGCNRFASA
jgi:hypothetical protein